MLTHLNCITLAARLRTDKFSRERTLEFTEILQTNGYQYR